MCVCVSIWLSMFCHLNFWSLLCVLFFVTICMKQWKTSHQKLTTVQVILHIYIYIYIARILYCASWWKSNWHVYLLKITSIDITPPAILQKCPLRCPPSLSAHQMRIRRFLKGQMKVGSLWGLVRNKPLSLRLIQPGKCLHLPRISGGLQAAEIWSPSQHPLGIAKALRQWQQLLPKVEPRSFIIVWKYPDKNFLLCTGTQTPSIEWKHKRNTCDTDPGSVPTDLFRHVSFSLTHLTAKPAVLRADPSGFGPSKNHSTKVLDAFERWRSACQPMMIE